jgi:hypothetical protein
VSDVSTWHFAAAGWIQKPLHLCITSPPSFLRRSPRGASSARTSTRLVGSRGSGRYSCFAYCVVDDP